MDESPKPKLREAGEVFLFMHRIFRASRNLRAHWYIDHLGQSVRIQPLPHPTASPPPPKPTFPKKSTSSGPSQYRHLKSQDSQPSTSTESKESESSEHPQFKDPKPEDPRVPDESSKPNETEEIKRSPVPQKPKLTTSSSSEESKVPKIEKVPDPKDEYSQEMTVIGIVPAGGDGTEVCENEDFLVTVNTKCTYISRYYRIVYVLDLSPSVVVADDESNCCLVDRVIPSLGNSLRSSVKAFVIPGTDRTFRPQVFTSICLFSPFMKFEETFTLCQGVFVTESNVNQVIEDVQKKFVDIYKRLFTFSRPILELWGKLKRRHKHNKFDSLCESDTQSEENIRGKLKGNRSRHSDHQKGSSSKRGDEEQDPPGGTSIMDIKRGIWKETEKPEDANKQLSFASDKSYVAPDWSLIFMLRMGLLQIQMLPENTQSNLVIVSDSVCGMPDEEALQNVLTQLRSYTVAFSFIQLQKKACTEAVFGHVGSSSLFYFMTMATFGTYLPRQKARQIDDTLMLCRNADGQLVIKRKEEFDDIIDMSPDNINQFHRALICWSFQNGLSENDYLLDTFAQINREFLELQQSNVDRHRRFQAKYQATLNRMMYVRLREGFTLKSTVFVKNNTQVILTLRLAFRPLVFIDYIIVSAWPVNKNVHQVVSVELVLEGPYNELKDLLTESNYLNPIRMNLIKSVIDGIIDADRTLLHIHSFDTKIAYFTIPPGVTKEHALFQQGSKSRRCMPQLCIVKPDDSVKTQGFANFWRKMLEVDDRNWQKWVHTQTERCLLNLIHVPFELFTTRRLLSFDTRYPLHAVLFSVKVRATFCLVENQTFVTLVYATERAKKPSYFFIRKVISNGPVTIVKTAFLGGVTSIERRRAVEAQRQRLINVTYGTILDEDNLMSEAKRYRYEPNAEKLYMDPQKIYEKRFDPACTVFRRPIERMVVRYNHVPADLTTIVRAEEQTDDPDEIMLLTLHNTLAKSLACRRSVIILNTFQLGGAHVVRLLADFCQNVLMHKRMHQEGFRPAWTQNNAVSLLRQVYDSSGASLEQFIMFPAITVQQDAFGRPILRRLSRFEQKQQDKNSKKYYNEKVNDDPVPNAMPLKTATETLAIVCEMWNEPEGGNPDDQLANMSAERRLHEDLRFISVLFTLDRIVRHSGQCSEAHMKIETLKGLTGDPNHMFPYEDRCRVTNIHELTGIPKKTPMTSDEIAKRKSMFQKSRRRTERLKTQQDFEKEWEREQAGMLDVPKPPTPGEFPIRYLRKKAEGEEEVLGELDEPFPYIDNWDTEIRPLPTVSDIHADAVSKFVTVYENLFSMTNLIYHAQRRYFPLPHFVLGLGEKDMPRCNGLQLNALHCQLSEVADLTWILHDTEQDVIFSDLVKTIPSPDRPAPTRLRVYVKALTARLVALIFAPVIDSFNPNSELIPMFIATVHETQIAHCYAQSAFDKHGIVSLPMSDVPDKWDSGARFGWTPNNRNVFPEEATTFTSFCKHFEDEILPRIRMRAMYEAAQEEIPLNEDALMDMSADVDCLEFEMTAIPKALRKVCNHLGPGEPSESNSDKQTLVMNRPSALSELKTDENPKLSDEKRSKSKETLMIRETPEPLKICCRGSNIAYMFDKMLAKNFKKVCGTQNMYYLDPQSMLEKNQKKPKKKKKVERRKRNDTRGSSGMMYVDGTESQTSLSELGDFSEEMEIVKLSTDENGAIKDDDNATLSADSSDLESESSSDSDATTSSDETPRPTSPINSSDGSEDDANNRNRVDSANMGEVYQEYTGHNQPMFIQFNCSVNFQGQVNSFPISFLPTCVHELLPYLDDPPTRPEDIAQVEIVLELIVLTTQSLSPKMDINEITMRLYRMAKSRVRNPYEFERHRRESYKKEEEEDYFQNPFDASDDDSESGKKSKKSGDVLFDLPTQERRVMTELVKNVELILELEKVLVDSRTSKVNVEMLEMVKKYIDNACTTSGKFGHAETRYKPFLLVDGSTAKQRNFMNSMTERVFGYLKLKRVRYSTLFYSNSIYDPALFAKHTAANPPIPGTTPESSVLGSDFWIILTVDTITNHIILHFCQRNEYQHTPALDLLWAAIRQELRVLNQESLLEMMYNKRKVDKLLVPEHRKISQFDTENGVIQTPPEPPRKPPQPPPGTMMPHEDLYYYFPEGYFACKAQRELWLPVPERVRNQSYLLHKNPLQMAFDRIKAPLLKYSVHNRVNTFVYKDVIRNKIFYFQLHMDRDSYELSIKGPEKKLRRKQAEAVDKLLETKICMTLFGIQEPHRDIIDEIWEALNEKVDSLLLVEIMRGYTQNLEQPLLLNEVEFLQPKTQEPQIRQFFSIPFIFQDYLSSILYYIGQHIEAFPDISPAKVKEKDIFYNGAAFNRAPVPTVWPAARSKSFRVQTTHQLQAGQPSSSQSKESLSTHNSPKEVSAHISLMSAQTKTEQSAIEEAVEATEAIGVFRSFSMDDKDPAPLNPVNIFRAHEPFTGTLPPNYLLSSFFVYHILPARGVVDTGLALIEFRICKPDGSLIAKFDQPAMNEQSHLLLVPNVPEDKATVYRDIIKSYVYPEPKAEKSVAGYVEMIVRTRGDVADQSIFEKMMFELIEMAMFDVITEFGYLNTTIVEEGSLTGHVALTMTNRNSDVFLPGQDTPSSVDQHQPMRNLTKQGSASSVTASVDTRHHAHHHNTHHPHAMPSHSNEMRRSLVLQQGPGSMDLGPPHSPLLPPSGPRTPATRLMPQVSKELSEYVQENTAAGFRRLDFMNRKNAYSIIKWLDHVASRQGETNSVIKQRIRFEFQHASLPALFEIRNRLEVSLGRMTDAVLCERVYLCGLRKPIDSTSEPGTATTTAATGFTTSSLSIFGTQPHEGRFEVLTTDPFHAMTEDIGVDESQNQEEYILVSCIRNVFEGFGENDVRTKTQIETMKLLFKNHLHAKYNPMVQTHIYSPRQRIMLAYLKGDFMTIYFYNYHTNIHKDAVDTMNKIVGFHNAKSRLLREIGLHKMGITHLSPFHTEPLNEYDYEVMIWTDPTTLISKEFPSEHKPPPAFMKEPQCSNIFFRMYRQPDLQVTMGRSKTLFKSDCVKTMHYEQLLRWRSGLKTKLDFIQKVTRAHMEMIKKIPTINEIDLLMFLRPPKVRSKLLGPPPTLTSSSSSVRHRHWDDDHHTIYEDNNSMTERTSKRASIFGESVKSQAVAESEIFKGKGEFVKKTDIKIGLAANKFHEIRTPFFLRSEWNKDVPRRSGELFDEVVRESDIRSLLEEPLKEFLEIYEVQKAKSTKLLMKRKYSEKSVDVQVVDVVVRNEKRRAGESPPPDPYHPEDEWSEVDSDLEEAEEMMVDGDDGAESTRTNSESRGPPKPPATGEENFQRTYGKVRRSWKKNPPTSPTPFDSRHNSFSSSIPMAKPSESGPIEKMFSSTINAVTKLTRRLSRKPVDKDTSIGKNGNAEDATPEPAPSPEPTDQEEFATEPAISPIMYKHAEEFARYFCKKYEFIQFQVENRNRRSKALNRYTTNPTMFLDLPYLVFYKAYDGGVIFADLRYEIPEFVVSFYMYERAKSSSADFYMVDQMEALYWKESEELQTAARQLKLQDSVCFMSFNFDYHLRTVATCIDAKANKKKCIFGTKMNAFHTLERLLDYYQHELILSKNLVAIKYVYMTKEQNDAILARAEDDRDLVLIKQEADPVTQNRYAGTPIEYVMCRITDTAIYETNLPVTIIEMTGLLSAYPTISGRQCSRVVPSVKLRIHMEDVGDEGALWPPLEDRDFIEEFEGRQRRRFLENMSKYGTEVVPTPWEDSCVRRTVKEMMAE